LIDSLRVRLEMAAAQEAYLSDGGAALAQMRDRLDEIERTNDRAAMREQIELLVPAIVVHTERIGETPSGRARKRMTAHLTLAFAQKAAVVPITNSPGSSSGSSTHRRVPATVRRRSVPARQPARSGLA
jgi:hypothetical protein